MNNLAKNKDAYLKLVARAHLGSGAVHLTAHILEFLNAEIGAAWPSEVTLAELSNVTPRQVRRWVATLERCGLLMVVKRKAEWSDKATGETRTSEKPVAHYYPVLNGLLLNGAPRPSPDPISPGDQDASDRTFLADQEPSDRTFSAENQDKNVQESCQKCPPIFLREKLDVSDAGERAPAEGPRSPASEQTEPPPDPRSPPPPPEPPHPLEPTPPPPAEVAAMRAQINARFRAAEAMPPAEFQPCHEIIHKRWGRGGVTAVHRDPKCPTVDRLVAVFNGGGVRQVFSSTVQHPPQPRRREAAP